MTSDTQDAVSAKRSLDELGTEPEAHEIWIEDDNGGYIGRITGESLYLNDDNGDEIFLTDDERVLAYDGRGQKVWQLDDDCDGTLEEKLRSWIQDNAAYVCVLGQLGLEVVIDL
jgi:hypothetical protein